MRARAHRALPAGPDQFNSTPLVPCPGRLSGRCREARGGVGAGSGRGELPHDVVGHRQRGRQPACDCGRCPVAGGHVLVPDGHGYAQGPQHATHNTPPQPQTPRTTPSTSHNHPRPHSHHPPPGARPTHRITEYLRLGETSSGVRAVLLSGGSKHGKCGRYPVRIRGSQASIEEESLLPVVFSVLVLLERVIGLG